MKYYERLLNSYGITVSLAVDPQVGIIYLITMMPLFAGISSIIPLQQAIMGVSILADQGTGQPFLTTRDTLKKLWNPYLVLELQDCWEPEA
ncbi:hypothetical protein ACE38W_21145 [Chitinophaga sp. Hz27]|uniref:hypothetical protein n=1 Tax=Chitinophaga sp. Hz27 TaxID=3347169 RepID=UPI0035DF5A77